jgi:hypothetical protein
MSVHYYISQRRKLGLARKFGLPRPSYRYRGDHYPTLGPIPNKSNSISIHSLSLLP